MRKGIFISCALILLACSASAQYQGEVVRATVNNGDTIPVIELREVTIISWRNLSSKEGRQMDKLMRNVKKVYPYAKLAGIKLIEYEDTLANCSTNKERKNIMKRVEKEIEAGYGQELRDLTISQGKILLKLIDRETGDSSYELVSDLRGEFRAVFYQAFARLFSYNLKVKYDPDGEDKEIEMIILMIERGEI